MSRCAKKSCLSFPWLVLTLLCLGLLATGCGVKSNYASSNTSEEGTLHVTVTVSPASPVETPDDRRSGRPLIGQQVRIETQSGTLVMTKTTNDQGMFSTTLPPGLYLVQVQSVRFPMRHRVPQTAVTVVAGQISTLNIVLDSGIR